MAEGQEEQKTCGNCENYHYHQAFGELEGWCKVIPGEKKGQAGKKVRFNTDASNCTQFNKIGYVYTDSKQVHYDPHLRVYGGYQEVKSDRLVYEKHEKEERKDE